MVRGDTVVIKKTEVVPAERVIVAPLEAMSYIDERYLANTLEGIPLVKGDNIMAPPHNRGRFPNGKLTFQVVDVTPNADAVVVIEKTIFHNLLFRLAGVGM